MNVQRFYELIDSDGKPTVEERDGLRNLIDQYPYFQAGIFIYLKALYQSNNYDFFESELSRISIFVNDRKALFYHIFSDDYTQFRTKTGKNEIKEDRTHVLLNAFFESRTDNDHRDTQLEYALSNSSLAFDDYLLYVENVEHKSLQYRSDEAENPFKHQTLIDSFIEKSAKSGGIHIHFDKDKLPETSNNEIENEMEVDNGTDELEDDMFFTETLAKIYIKQKKYDKAYKIIKHLSLNYPKKNIYFADQLGFLEKLIINSKYKK